jgi:hypothetical protein
MEKSSEKQPIPSVSSDELQELMNHPQNDAPAGAESDEQTDDPDTLYDIGVPNASPPQ